MSEINVLPVEIQQIAQKAEQAERERIRKENERLKKEAEQREIKEREQKELIRKRGEILRPYLVFICDYNNVLSLPEDEFLAELEKLKKACKKRELLQKKAENEHKELEHIAAELKQKQYAERKAANAPEKEKLLIFADALDKMQRPQVNTVDAVRLIENVDTLLCKVTAYIREKCEKL